MIRHAIIMAAGRGISRLAPLTDAIPKPMVPYDGTTLIARGISRLAPLTDAIPKPMVSYDGTTLIARGISRLAARVEHIHVTVGYKKAMLAQHVIEHGASSVLNTEGKSNCWWLYNTLLSRLTAAVKWNCNG